MIPQRLALTFERLGINGEGIGSFEGYTLFVQGVLPGEMAEVELYERHKSYGRAKLLRLIKSSPDRIKPPCPLFGHCGGCQIMHLDYPKQLESKRQRVIDALERIGKFSSPRVLPCLESPNLLGYRNKIQLPCDHLLNLGLYALDSHEIVPVDRCFIHCPLGERVFEQINALLKKNPIETLKALLIKSAVKTGQVLVVIVTTTPAFPAGFAEKIIDACPEVKGVVHNVNEGPGNRILGHHSKTIKGLPSIEDELLGLKFKVSPASFFQVNPGQAERLYQRALDLAELTGQETVLDAYSGVGTLALVFARKAKKVIGIESVKEAVRDARENAQINGLFNTEFIGSPVETAIASFEKIDVAILNPPRKGCEKSVIEKINRLKPKRLLYISCDPATLARDLKLLEGYEIVEIQPFDMFPQTAHVETLVSLKRSLF